MNCLICDKKLRSHNKIGTCRVHRNISPTRQSYMASYAKKNQKSISAYKARWRKSNRVRLNTQQKERLKNDINAKIAHALRARINRAIVSNFKAGSVVKDLGCSIEFLCTYLAAQFEVGMSWENHGSFGWHIDHIKPLALFDLQDKEQFKEACHYTNLRPRWWRQNIVEGQETKKFPRVSSTQHG